MFVKKALLLVPTLLMTSPLLFSCAKTDPNVAYLKVLNSEDYIDETIFADFEQKESAKIGKPVKIIYEKFDTMENMFNTLKTGKTSYDLVCMSDYMVQKLVNLNLLEKLDYSALNEYDKNASPFIRERLKGITWGDNYKLDDYCACYMWGTFGLLYNPNYYLLKDRGLNPSQVAEDMKSWNSLWDTTHYQKVISIKDSMRDTYALGLIHSYQDELKDKSPEEKQRIFNYGGEDDEKANEHINTIKQDLITLRNNIFGFEVDSGKEDIVTEKIGIDTAWSGDAVKAINIAEKEKALDLYYSIPNEGSNLWFDCWTMQKGANQDLAYDFLNYLSNPDIAIKNMDVIGYTSSIVGTDDTIYNYYSEKYKPTSPETTADYDVSYFFEDGRHLSVDKKYIGRQVSAQFPTSEETNRLMIMKDYGNNNDLILKMWEEVKHEALPTWAIVLFVVEIAVIITAITVIVTLRIRNKKRRKERKTRTA